MKGRKELTRIFSPERVKSIADNRGENIIIVVGELPLLAQSKSSKTINGGNQFAAEDKYYHFRINLYKFLQIIILAYNYNK